MSAMTNCESRTQRHRAQGQIYEDVMRALGLTLNNSKRSLAYGGFIRLLPLAKRFSSLREFIWNLV